MSKLSPEFIYNYVSNYVVGQEEAKVAVANAVFMHYVRWKHGITNNKQLKASSILLTGPSGSGKTFLIRKAAEAVRSILGEDILPVLEIDCTQITAAGWKGNDIDQLLQEPYKTTCMENMAIFTSTILFFDEIDKLCGSGKSDVASFNRGTQYSLLKIVEGSDVQITVKKKAMTVNTGRMLSIFAGNFPEVRKNRLDSARTIGFIEPEKKEVSALDLHKELQNAGLATQLVGRIAVVKELAPLSRKQLKTVLLKSSGSVYKEYQEIFEYMGYDLTLSDYLANKIVDKCIAAGVGVRGLQVALEEQLQKDIFKVTIDEEEEHD